MDSKYTLFLSGLLTENQYYGEADKKDEIKHYMFFNNLKTIKDKVDAMLAMDHAKIDKMLADGHDWASDHITSSKDDVEEVYNWIAGSIKKAD